MFKTLHINVSFVEVLAQMPRYAKILKELLTNKKLEEVLTVALSERRSTLLIDDFRIKKKILGAL